MAARWTEPNIEYLKAAWAQGRTASEIATELSRNGALYMTRNMVIGKAHRLGLEARPSPIVRGEKQCGVTQSTAP